MFLPGTLLSPALRVRHSAVLCVDFKASGEESKVSLRSDECRSTGNTAAQTKEEGRQDGLKTALAWRAVAERHHRGMGYPLHTVSFASFVPPFSIPFLSIFLSFAV